jgi:hypothetical protein
MNNSLTLSVQQAIENDPKAKAWIMENQPLFTNSQENSDMFLTTYRIRNAYEDLLNRLEVGEYVTDQRDMTLIQRLFDMDFYPPRKMNLSDWKEGRDPYVRIVTARKDRRWEGRGRNKRPFEITLELDNGEVYQVNPNDIVNKFLHIRNTFGAIVSSDL